MHRRALAAALLALLAPLAGATERPDWLSGSPREFPSSAFLTGVGEGPTQEKAADRARAEIAKALGTQVTAATAISSREAVTGRGSSVSQEVSEDVRTYTAKVLEGVEVPLRWRDDKGVHYAMAVLDRVKTAGLLRDKIGEHDSKIARGSVELPEAEGKFSRLKLALQLLSAYKARRKLNGDLRVLSPDGKGIPPPDGYEEALSAARKAVKAIKVFVSASGESPELVGDRLAGGLSSRGLRTVEKGGGKPDIVVRAAAEVEVLPAENLLWQWARGGVRVELAYGSSGEVFARFEESGQESGNDPDAAADAALKALAERCAERAYQAILSRELEDD